MTLNISDLREEIGGIDIITPVLSDDLRQLLDIVESQKKIRQLYDEIGIAIDADNSTDELYKRVNEEQVRCDKLLDDVEVDDDA